MSVEERVSRHLRILVTGATGRVGANLVRTLAERGHVVRSLVLPDDPGVKKLTPLDTEVVHGDLRGLSGVAEAVTDMNVVVHCGAIMHEPKGVARQDIFDVNTRGTFALLEASARSRSVHLFVLLSSTAVYDVLTAEEFPTTERAPLKPLTLYGVTKVLCEEMALRYHYQFDLPVVVLRSHYIQACDEVLNGWTAESAIKRLKGIVKRPKAAAFVAGLEAPWELIEKVASSPQQLFIPRAPNGESWCEHRTDVRDVVEAIRLVVELRRGVGEIFNVCGPAPTLRERAVKFLAERTNADFSECVLPIHFRSGFSNAKAEVTLHYRPTYDIVRMIESGLAFRDGADIGVIPTAAS
jgi:nucleoside-diphosphate-sugar epimerase